MLLNFLLAIKRSDLLLSPSEGSLPLYISQSKHNVRFFIYSGNIGFSVKCSDAYCMANTRWCLLFVRLQRLPWYTGGRSCRGEAWVVSRKADSPVVMNTSVWSGNRGLALVWVLCLFICFQVASNHEFCDVTVQKNQYFRSIFFNTVISRMRWVGHVTRMGGEERRIQGFGGKT